jgi:hypothetical protein
MLSEKELLDVVSDIARAEELQLPGFARQQYVIALAIGRASQSPPPIWIWLLVKVLEALIPEILEWLKARYGDAWPAKVADYLTQGRLPWA